MLKIYVAGPLSHGSYSDTTRNIRAAIDYAESIFLLGGAPYLPHLTHFWNLFYLHAWEEWMELDRQYVLACDALFRVPGESKGADLEVGWAKEAGKPVYHRMEEVEYAIRTDRTKKGPGPSDPEPR